MKKVLYIGSVYPTLHGAAEAGKQFVEGVGGKDIKVILLNTIFNKKLDNLERNSYFKLVKLIYYLFKLVLLLIINKIDAVVIMHSYRWEAFYKDSLFIRICFLFRKNVILYAQGEGFYGLFYEKLNEARKRYVDAIFQRVTKIVVVSKSLIQEYIKWISKDKISVIYNVTDPIFTKEEIISRSESKGIKLLFLSAVTEAKGIFDLLEVFNLLSQTRDNIELVICGDFLKTRNIDKINYNNFIENHNLGNKVLYKGRVKGNEKKLVFEEADIFVLPTLRESFGIVNIEAMSAGLPIVSTFQGAIPEYIENGVNGFLFEAGDKDSLKECILKLIDNNVLRKTIQEANRVKFFSLFSKEIFVEKWKKVLSRNM